MPMHYAAARGDIDMCNLLKDAGADVNAADAQGSTPLLMDARRETSRQPSRWCPGAHR